MKKLLLIFVLFLSSESYSQSLSVFDIDASEFPTIKAKFYAFDAGGNQLTNLSPSDFEVTENGKQRTVTDVSCPEPQPPTALSSVLTMDASGSMGGGNLDLAKEAAKAWIEGLPLGQSECAITAFDTKNYFVQDFTTDETKLLNAANSLFAGGGTNYDAAMLNPMAGGLLATKSAQHKRVIVFLSDGRPNSEPRTSEIIAEANNQNVTVFAVTLRMSCPNNLKDISEQTGGQWFENVTTVEEAIEIYQKILMTAQGGDPCEIEWESAIACEAYRDVNLTCLQNFQSQNIKYYAPSDKIAKLEIIPFSVRIGEVEPGTSKDTIITITATNSDFEITDITSSNPDFEITPNNFSLANGESKDLTLTFTPQDSAYSFSRFEIESTPCSSGLYATGGYSGVFSEDRSILLTHPNGGEEFLVGSDTVITWEGLSPTEPCYLKLSLDSGKTWEEIAQKAFNNQTNWNTRYRTSNKCLMKILPNVENQYISLGIGKLNAIEYIDSLYISANGNSICLWNYNTGDLIKQKREHNNFYISDIIVSPDKKYLFSLSENMVIKWSLPDLNVLQKYENGWIFDYGSGANLLSCLHKQNILYVTAYDRIIIFNNFDLNKDTIIELNQKIYPQIDIDSNEKIAVLYSNHIDGYNSGFIFYDLINKQPQLIQKTNSLGFANIFNNGQEILYYSDKKLYKFNRKYKTNIDSIIFDNTTNYPTCSKIINDSLIVLSMSDGNINIYTLKTFQLIQSTQVGYSAFELQNINGEEILLATTSNIINYDLNKQKSKIQIYCSGHYGDVFDVDWSPDGFFIASCGRDTVVYIWDANTGDLVKSLTGHIFKPQYSPLIRDIAWSSNGAYLFSLGQEGDIIQWDVENWNIMKEFNFGKKIYNFTLSQDNEYIICVFSDYSISACKIKDISSIIKLSSLEMNPYTLVSSKQFISTISLEGDIVYIWKYPSFALYKKINISNPRGILYSGDIDYTENILSLGDHGYIKSFDIAAGKEILPEFEIPHRANDIKWAPFDHNFVSVGGYNNDHAKIILSKPLEQSIENKISNEGHDDNAIDWSPDGSRIVVGGDHGQLRIWNMNFALLTDISDSLWSIVAPVCTAQDVDMGQVLVNTTKDSLITAYLKNPGTYPCRIDTIYFSGTDAGQFDLVTTAFPFTIDKGAHQDIEFRFMPSSTGIKTAEIIIITQANTLIQHITGEGIEPQFAVIGDIIDFGIIDVGKSKDSLQAVTIKNIGTEPLNISNTQHNKPNDYDFSTLSGGGSFTLHPGDTCKMDLRFSPSDEGRTSGTLEFYYNGVGSPAIVQLYGEGVRNNPQIKAYADVIPDLICDYTTTSNIRIDNTGGKDLIITGININDTDAGEFKINEPVPVTVGPDSSRTIEITFIPNSIGEKEAEIEIISNADPDSIMILQLLARKDSAALNFVNDIFDLGSIYLNESKDTNITIINTGSLLNNGVILASGVFTINTNTISLNPAENTSINIDYSGSAVPINIDEEIILRDSICNRESKVRILLSVIAEPSIVLQIPEIQAYPGDIINIPVILNDEENVLLSGASAIKADLEYNSTLLWPLDHPQTEIDENTARITLDNIPVLETSGVALLTIPFEVGLGNTDGCDLILSNEEAVGGTAIVTSIPGSFTLLGICPEGGPRLVNSNTQTGILSLSPNPAENKLEVELAISEEGYTELAIYNIMGEKTLSIFEEDISSFNNRIIPADISNLSSGQYILIFKTPTYVESRQIVIIK